MNTLRKYCPIRWALIHTLAFFAIGCAGNGPQNSETGFVDSPVSCSSESPLKIDETNPNPQILMIGDSISRGYSPCLREALKADYNVEQIVHPNGVEVMNARNSNYTLENIDYMLSKCRNCEVIIWNNGLWNTSRPDVSSKQDWPTHYFTTTEQYQNELVQIAQRLQATGAQVIFTTSSTLPPSTAYFFEVGRERELNEAARTVLEPMGIKIIDIYSFTATLSNEMREFVGTPHWGNTANKLLGNFVANELLKIVEQ